MPARMLGASRRQAIAVTSQAIAVDEMIETVPAAAATAPPATPQNVDGVCQSGLNGLTAGGTEGLDTVCSIRCMQARVACASLTLTRCSTFPEQLS